MKKNKILRKSLEDAKCEKYINSLLNRLIPFAVSSNKTTNDGFVGF